MAQNPRMPSFVAGRRRSGAPSLVALGAVLAVTVFGGSALANTDGRGVATDPSTLWMVAAVNLRHLPSDERVGLRFGEAADTAAVAELICEVHATRPPCGRQCRSDRTDRAHLPDRSSYVVDEATCWDLARILVAGAHDYDVPIDVLLAVAYQESRFREYALGAGTECGMFQQTTTHIRWASEHVPRMARVALPGDEVCGYLLRPENAVWHFALKYHHERAQTGSNWAAYYNGGPNMWAYQRSVRTLSARFAGWLEAHAESTGLRYLLVEAGG